MSINYPPPLSRLSVLDKTHDCRNDKSEKRLEFVDLAKGISIIVIVLMHCRCELVGGAFLTQFLGLPMYFVLAGMFFKDYGGYLVSVENKINKLIVPFLFFYLVGDLMYWSAYKLGLLSVSLVETPFIGILLGESPENIPIWFLAALFDIYVVFLVVYRLFPTVLYRVLALTGFSILGLVVAYERIALPFYLSQALFALPFFCYGYLLRRSRIIESGVWNRCVMILLILLPFAVYIPLRYDEGMIFADFYYYGNPLMLHIYAMIIVLGVLSVCRMIGSRLRLISYVGRFSLIILGVHWLVMTICISVLGMVYGGEGSFPRWLLSICVLTISAALIWPCVKFIPYFVAQKDITPIIRRKLKKLTNREVEVA
ncbi:MAG: acyltransferase [Pseudoflavonifractor sp.]|nr:acyltransferase [Pseudoflavonifractor sp.]